MNKAAEKHQNKPYGNWLADHFELFFDTCYSGAIVLNLESNIAFFNKSAADLFGIAAEDVLGHPLTKIFTKSTANMLLFRENLQSQYQFSYHDKEILHSCILMEVGGEKIGSFHLFKDVTWQKQVESELNSVKEREEDLEGIIQSSYDGIYITDYTGKTLMVNKSHERITGIKASDIVGKNMREIVDEGLVSVFITDTVVNGKAPVTVRQSVSNGKQVIITGSPILDKYGNVKKVITNVRDVTELIELEKHLKATKEMVNIYKKEIFKDTSDGRIVCDSKAFQKAMELAGRVASKDSTVLILGETGVGKEVVAKYIHSNSKRKNNNYIKINCGAIPVNLLESELFGYVKGAFTGASQTGKIGMFELANEGTIFLDEIGELPLNLQASLLRVLQENVITRVGDTKVRKVDVRIIAATNRDLEKMIEEKTFRSDLFYRLNVVSITVPPLRERVDDIPGLAESMISKLNEKYNEKKIITSNFISLLCGRDWPGNVREMENFIEKQFVISEEDIMDSFYSPLEDAEDGSNSQIMVNGIVPLKEAVKRVEYILIRKALLQGHTTYKAAELLGTSQPTLFRKYKELVEENFITEEDIKKIWGSAPSS
ncbi:MAG TPA: sigma 54-interacting transcriptional regulator [Anaerovoracaceae bacterium]|nr:sigma 54-interacting transcriptional regulator [Anaerovoracaceae bacterium]